MGEVYRADDLRLDQPVALKFLSDAFAGGSSGRIERLVDEVRVGRQISHPNVCRLYDIAEASGHHFLVMEYVDGEDLASLLRRIGRLSGDKAMEIARGICAGLAAAHDKGVIHRDLKPANVMIDGRGHARLADFGLAALASGGAATDMSGTPQYMAPEQLMGEGASLRSDVYALGLVLHEMLTGKRVFEAKSLNDLRAQHNESKLTSVSSSTPDVDATLDGVVMRCLSRNPNDRPASAREVLTSLPGNDILEAAVRAGETPSPEMVAADSTVGDLRPSVAWAGLALGLALLWAIASLNERVALFRLVALTKSPEVLVERARVILGRLGASDPPADSAFGFSYDRDLARYIESTDLSPLRRVHLASSRPPVVRFYYRQSPTPLVANEWTPSLAGRGPPEFGRVTRTAPPFTVPGMAEVELDPQGSLVSFARVPPRFSTANGPFPDPDWSIPLIEAGLDPRLLTTAIPRWAGPTESDHRAAWDGAYPDRPDVALHIEAAAYHGRPVYFEVQGPWIRPPAPVPQSETQGRGAARFVGSMALLFAGAMLVRRNLRLGRGDRRGALRMALGTFGLMTLALLLRVDHTRLAIDEASLVVQVLSQACFAATCCWGFYVGIEPAVRRRWPHRLISWTRLIAGQVTDALVARDTLVGVLCGLAVVVTSQASHEAQLWFFRPASLTSASVLASLDSPRHVAYHVLRGPLFGVFYSLALLYGFYVLESFTKRRWLAQLLAVLIFVVPPLFATEDHGMDGIAGIFDAGLGIPQGVNAIAGVFIACIAIAVVSRFGFLSLSTMIATYLISARVPLTLDTSAWYFGRSSAAFGFLVVMLASSAYLSLNGKPIFGNALLDE